MNEQNESCVTTVQECSIMSQLRKVSNQRFKIGRFKRKSKGKEYSCLRLLLSDVLGKYEGRHFWVYEAKVSVGLLKNRAALVLVMLPELNELFKEE